MRTDSLRVQLAGLGYRIADADIDHARERLSTLPPISDEQHARNLATLARYDTDAGG